MNWKSLLSRDPASLNAEEKAALREHVSEMSAEEKSKFADAIKEEGMDEEAVKQLLQKNIGEAIAPAVKKINEIAEEISGKFLDGVKDQRARIAAGEKVVKDEKKDSVTRKFFIALLNGDRAAAKALTTSDSGVSPDDAKAGLLIPEELRAEVLRISETQYGFCRRNFMYLPFSGPGNERKIPTLGTSVNVYWTDEAEPKTSTQPKFNVVTQTLKKLAAIVPFTEEILEDSAINLTQLVATLFAEAIAKEVDIQFLTGTGAPWTGILNNGNVNVVTSAAAASASSADDLIDMQDATPSDVLPGAKYLMHRTVLSVYKKLKGSDGQYIFPGLRDDKEKTINGYPVETNDAMPTLASIGDGDPFVIFGNFQKACVYGDKQTLRVKMLTEATVADTDGSTRINLAEQDMVALRIVQRVGMVAALPQALTVLKAGADES